MIPLIAKKAFQTWTLIASAETQINYEIPSSHSKQDMLKSTPAQDFGGRAEWKTMLAQEKKKESGKASNPEFLVYAKCSSQSTIKLQFADGVRGSFPAAKLGMPIEDIKWQTLKPSTSGSAATVEGIRGGLIHIDSGALRCLVDKDYASNLGKSLNVLLQPSQIESFSNLEDDWDGYGAASPSKESLLNAKEFSRQAAITIPSFPPSVYPGRNGGMSFTWKNKSHRLDVRILPGGLAQYGHLDLITDASESGEFNLNDSEEFWLLLKNIFSIQ